jgi:hypothetical protein
MLAEPLTLEQLERSLIELASIAVVPVASTDPGQRAERWHEFGMACSERALLDGEGAP